MAIFNSFNITLKHIRTKRMKLYSYKSCSTCQKAVKFLESKKVQYESIAIIDHPPTINELKKMLAFIKIAGGSIKSIFNTSGVQYRELEMAEKLNSGLTENEALKILSTNGKLIKRPFLLSDDFGLVGFRAETWAEAFLKV